MAKRNYSDLTKTELIQLLEARDRRDATRFGLVWEANEIERDTDTVLWWHRNEARKPWSINVLMENGQNFYPDFIIGIRNRNREDNGLLVDPKEAYQRTSEIPKLLAEHASYGRVLILTKGNANKRWEIASWNAAENKPVIEGRFLIREAHQY